MVTTVFPHSSLHPLELLVWQNHNVEIQTPGILRELVKGIFLVIKGTQSQAIISIMWYDLF